MAILKQQQGLINAYGSCLGSWRQSEREDTGGERVAAAATRGIATPSAPNPAGASGYDGILRTGRKNRIRVLLSPRAEAGKFAMRTQGSRLPAPRDGVTGTDEVI